MSKSNGKIISLDIFKKSINGMIATSEDSYERYTFKKGTDFSQYSREEILEVIESGTPSELEEVSVYYSYVSGFYKRFLTYYSTLLKYNYLLVPHIKKGKQIADKRYFDRYNRALDFMTSLNLKRLSEHIAFTVLQRGSYYGVFRDFGKDGFAVQDLPSKYCRSRFKNQKDVSIVELRLSYFNTIRDEKVRKEVLQSYPKDIQSAYYKYSQGKIEEWYMIEPGDGLYFTLNDERPYFASILPAIIDFKDYRTIEKEKDMQDLKSLLIQKLPIEDGELVFDPEEAQEIHRGSVNMLRNNKNTDVLTTFADVRLEDMESSYSKVTDNLEKIEKSIYTEAGVSKQLFSADTNMALQHSITNDMTLMISLAEQIALWVQYKITDRFADGVLEFKVKILPFSYYNAEEQRKASINMAQYGYSFFLPFFAFDLDQGDLVDLKHLEIEGLHLDDIMLPLASSFTTPGTSKPEKAKLDQEKKTGNSTDQVEATQEANEVSDGEKSEKTIKNINSGGKE